MRADRWCGWIAALAVAVPAARGLAQQTWYVDDDAPGDPGPGNPSVSDPLENGSPAHPYDAIQQAVNRAADGDTVLVLPGTYRGTGNRNISFFGKMLTLRSRDGAATCTIDAQAQGRAIELSSLEPPGTVIRGFTVRGASSGGVYVLLASLRLLDCRISNNTSPGVIADVGAFLEVDGCSITDNSTTLDGGGMRIDGDSIVLISRCAIQRNTAGRDGGGISASASDVRIYNCLITDNTAGGTVFGGGGIIYYGATGVTANSLIACNRTSARDGGGVLINGVSVVGLRTSTIVRNRAARTGGGLYADASPDSDAADCILWTNTPQSVAQGTSPLPIVYCDVEGGWFGAGNIAADPRFVDPLGPDGNPLTCADNDYRLGPGSPCIDAGDSVRVPPDSADLDGDTVYGEPTPIDLDGAARLVDDPATPDTGHGSPVVDLGAYEASGACPADLNGDGVVDFADYLEFLNFYDALDARADFNGDGVIDFADYLEFLNRFDAGC